MGQGGNDLWRWILAQIGSCFLQTAQIQSAAIRVIVATGLLFWPVAPFFLFMHGKDITVPKGAEVTAYVNGDMKLIQAKFTSPGPDTSATAATSGSSVGASS